MTERSQAMPVGQKGPASFEWLAVAGLAFASLVIIGIAAMITIAVVAVDFILSGSIDIHAYIHWYAQNGPFMIISYASMAALMGIFMILLADK